MKKIKRFWRELSISKKVYFLIFYSTCIIFAVNMIIWNSAQGLITQIDSVYGSNVSLSDLQESLEAVQESMTAYLDNKTSSTMEQYFSDSARYSQLIQSLEKEISSKESRLMEKNIRCLSETYLALTNATVEAKRARNVEKYKADYEQSVALYGYIQTYIYSLNNSQFKKNANQYSVLLQAMGYTEGINFAIIAVMMLIEVLLLSAALKKITKPLSDLSRAAGEVAAGNFDTPLPESVNGDEVGTVVAAFTKMVISVRTYIEELKKSMQVQAELKQHELEMENNLKDAKLKYLQAQIHPHFLFNCLNAGVQLTMLEDAPKSYAYFQNMADFFRYNLKGQEEVTLEEEIKLIDQYMYILNVRYAGEIQYEKQIDESVLSLKMPSMVLQPIVENSVKYGIGELERDKKIEIEVTAMDKIVCICVRDNGVGISKEQIEKIMSGEHSEEQSQDSNGVGLANVISRLKLFYHTDEVVEINNLGHHVGTEVMLYLPLNQGEI